MRCVAMHGIPRGGEGISYTDLFRLHSGLSAKMHRNLAHVPSLVQNTFAWVIQFFWKIDLGGSHFLVECRRQ